jgi:hypothetical protein
VASGLIVIFWYLPAASVITTGFPSVPVLTMASPRSRTGSSVGAGVGVGVAAVLAAGADVALPPPVAHPVSVRAASTMTAPVMVLSLCCMVPPWNVFDVASV